jgi:gas vesicle protein
MKITALITIKKDNMENSNDSLKMIGTLLVGAAIGGVLGMLFAPVKGSVLRKQIAGKPEELTDALNERLDDFLEEVKREILVVKHKANDFIGDGTAKHEKAR